MIIAYRGCALPMIGMSAAVDVRKIQIGKILTKPGGKIKIEG